MLETCFGLGYSALHTARTAESVLAFEVDPNVLRMARLNPYSAPVFEPGSRIEVRADLRRRLADYGGATVVVTHDALDAFVLADRLVVLEDGRIAELVGRLFGATTRVGRPLGMTNFSETARGPAFAVASGLLVYPQFAGREHFEPRRRHAGGEANYVTRVGRWLRESF